MCAVDIGFGGNWPQCGDDLGERMYHALADGLLRCERVILVGSDCPGIDRQYLHSAVRALDAAEVVLGPALRRRLCTGGRQAD